MPQSTAVAKKIKGESLAKRLASWLVSRSAWFQLLPLPDDEWEFTFKPEHKAAFDAYVKKPECNISNEGGALELHKFDDRNHTPEEMQLIERAREEHQVAGECEIDEPTVVSENDTNGAYVLAWVFVYYTAEERKARGLPPEDE